MRVFLDTNVLVSAFTARGICEDLFRYLVASHEVMTGEVNLQELRRILSSRFQASEAQVEMVESQLRDQIIVPRPGAPSVIDVRDPDDGWVLASAEAGAAEMLIAGPGYRVYYCRRGEVTYLLLCAATSLPSAGISVPHANCSAAWRANHEEDADL